MLSAISGLIGAYLEARAIKQVTGELATYLDNWARLIASILITAIVTFPVAWGTTGLGALATGQESWRALLFGFLSALLATGLIIYNLWTRSPLTKGIAVAIPSEFVEAALQQNVTITERK